MKVRMCRWYPRWRLEDISLITKPRYLDPRSSITLQSVDLAASRISMAFDFRNEIILLIIPGTCLCRALADKIFNIFTMGMARGTLKISLSSSDMLLAPLVFPERVPFNFGNKTLLTVQNIFFF